MSEARIRVICYPADDGMFGATVGLRVHVAAPGPVHTEHLRVAVEEDLRASYPFARISVVAPDDGGPEVWHIYRDGLAS